MRPFSLSQALIGLTFAVLLVFFSFRFRFLTIGGAIASAVMGTVIFGLGGLPWAVPLLIFFFSSSLLSHRKNNVDIGSMFEKTATRDAWQVLANGGVGGILVVLQFLVTSDKYYLAYLGSIAAVTADTWGTEVGMFTKGKTFLITTFQPVPQGTSGGVSILGTALSISGAFLIALSGWWWLGEFSTGRFAQVAVAGVVGSLLDSILGATVQAQYKCSQCGRVTERLMHCNARTGMFRGFRWFTNDRVNGICAGAGALAAVLL